MVVSVLFRRPITAWRLAEPSRLGLAMALVIASGFLSDAVALQQATDNVQPEITTERTQKPLVTARKHMVVAANPYATQAGLDILRQGGNAVDAMVAVQLVLGLVEPQSSGLGGGAFLLYFDSKENRLTTFDGRETAPAAVDGNLFLNADGSPMQFFDAVVGGRSVGTPGTLRLLEEVHREHGRLAWKQLFGPAIELAEKGFEVSPRLNALISYAAEHLYRFEATRNYFLSEEGVPLFPGTMLKNPAYAQTLRAIADGGADRFYTGPIAADIVAAVTSAPGNPGFLSAEDLAGYKIVEREPVCITYRQYQVCGMGPPSSGALTVGQILKLAEPHHLDQLGPNDPNAWRIIGDASRLAFADRGKYMADSDFVAMPGGLLDDIYMRERAAILSREDALPDYAVNPGDPPSDHSLLFAPDRSLELPSTSHFSIADGDGNIVSMTTTIENGFGSRLMVRGFLLNNELTDFSFLPVSNAKPVANRVEPGKRPRSSMSPTVVFKDGEPLLAIGSPGGSRIIGYVAKTLIAVLDWNMDIQAAIELPHLVNRWGVYDLEADTGAQTMQDALEALGFETQIRDLNSGLHGIAFKDGVLLGGADPRREGLAAGD